ncbi:MULTISPECIES: hypothetical protein [unclassified Lysinibacillus]|nr:MULTISPECIES: hypothetical protein [unclassified Lysinibacillus]
MDARSFDELAKDIRGVRYVEKLYETLADLELSIHTLEAIGELKIARLYP